MKNIQVITHGAYPRAVAVKGEGCLANAAAAARPAAGKAALALRCIAAPRSAVATQHTLAHSANQTHN